MVVWWPMMQTLGLKNTDDFILVRTSILLVALSLRISRFRPGIRVFGIARHRQCGLNCSARSVIIILPNWAHLQAISRMEAQRQSRTVFRQSFLCPCYAHTCFFYSLFCTSFRHVSSPRRSVLIRIEICRFILRRYSAKWEENIIATIREKKALRLKQLKQVAKTKRFDDWWGHAHKKNPDRVPERSVWCVPCEYQWTNSCPAHALTYFFSN